MADLKHCSNHLYFFSQQMRLFVQRKRNVAAFSSVGWEANGSLPCALDSRMSWFYDCMSFSKRAINNCIPTATPGQQQSVKNFILRSWTPEICWVQMVPCNLLSGLLRLLFVSSLAHFVTDHLFSQYNCAKTHSAWIIPFSSQGNRDSIWNHKVLPPLWL